MISNADKLACAKRELNMREHVYERRVAEHKMRKETADREIAVMAAIVEDYEKLAESERLI